ncbi:hypothetical protein [Halomonas icarae]|uniref:LysR substrate-binding domain-containing protein n=1 Tax=Halomonas icarae TaxID=2691040 RepID=A0A7X5ANY5_9GAMM|nr:hypothetical protein [Halomonas icarae]MDR5902461.1 hypothetical protein [Halomonas icarae]NAW14118.1 hypothetical protein [Halomonas icarae]
MKYSSGYPKGLQEHDLQMELMCEVCQIGIAGRMVAAGLGVSALPSLNFRQISFEGFAWEVKVFGVAHIMQQQELVVNF